MTQQQLSFAGFGGPRHPDARTADVDPPAGDIAFFAAYPQAEDAMRLSRLADELRREHGLSGRPIDSARLHVTLHVLGMAQGSPPEHLAAAMERNLPAVPMAPFEASFDHALSFAGSPGNRAFVLLEGDGVKPLALLQRTLAAAMRRTGRAQGALTTPHMTLLYDARDVAKRAIEPVRWTVREVVLVRSLRGRGQHVPLARIPLRG